VTAATPGPPGSGVPVGIIARKRMTLLPLVAGIGLLRLTPRTVRRSALRNVRQ